LSKSEIIIRQAEIFDLPNLKPLWLEFMQHHKEQGEKYDFFPKEWPTVLKRFIKILEEDHAAIFLAEYQGNLIGYTFGFIFTNYPGYFPKEVGFINDFIITKSCRNRGVGLRLFKKMEKWFNEQDINIVQLYVSFPNKLGKKFWENCGFENYLVGMWKEI
jgi:GNAT superfamily N-acetyltransferase